MHGNLSPVGTPDHNQNKQHPFDWPVLVLTFGGVLTVAWIGFLLWLAFQLGSLS